MQQNLCTRSKSILDGLTDHWTLGTLRLREFRYLFVESKDRVKLLNTITGGAFLYDVQQIFWDDLMLCVTRLTDQSRIGSNENLTVRLLTELPEVQTNQALCSEVERRVDAAVRSAEPCRKYRHKRISHLDLQSDIAAVKPIPVKRANMVEVKAALDEIHGCLNAVRKRLLDVELPNVPPVGRGRSKVFALNSEKLAEAVQAVDSWIDPTGQLDFKDQGAAVEFLRRLDRPTTCENCKKVVSLRELALEFKSEDE